MRKTTSIIFLSFLFLGNLKAQTFQYLKIQFDSTYNLKISQISWKSGSMEYPTVAMTAYNRPAPLQVTGDAPIWQLFYLYDDSPQTVYVGHVLNSDDFTKSYTLDLGTSNGIKPDSIVIEKPVWSGLTHFKVLLSNDDKNWELYLDTTIINSSFSTESFSLSKVQDTEKPSKPTGLKNSLLTDTKVRLDWSPSTDDYGVDKYYVFQNNTLIDSSRYTSYGVHNLSESSTYNFHISARDNAGNISATSDAITINTKAIDNINPKLTGTININNLESKSVKISWNNASDNQGIAGYLLWLNDSYTDISEFNTFTFSGLKDSTLYSIKVFAKDQSGNLSDPLSISVFTPKYKGTMALGTNFWNQEWSIMSNQLFINGHQDVQGSNPWKPALLDELNYAKTLRFMEMQQINRDAGSDWLSRKKKTNINQDEIAYEWMIDLCNRKSANLWICLPTPVIHRDGVDYGTQHYIRKLAILIKTGIDLGDANLDDPSFSKLTELTAFDLLLLGGKKVCKPLESSLKIYIEYGNENWNTLFPQSRYVRNEGTAMAISSNEWSSGRLFTAYASLQLFKEFEAVFGVNAERVETVLPLHGAELFFLYQSLSNVFDLAQFNPTKIYPDIISGATYFGGRGSINGDDPDIDSILRTALNDNITAFKIQKDSLTSWGKSRNTRFRLVSYEGGHHVTNNYDSLNANPLIYDLYSHFLDTMAYDFEEIVLYNHVSTNAFGLKQFVGQPIDNAHKYRAVIDWLKSNEQKEIIDLKVVRSNENIKLDWNTNGEVNYRIFIVEKSSNGLLFDSIGLVTGAGSTSSEMSYVFTDKKPYAGSNYYRLRQIDLNENSSQSGTAMIYFASSSIAHRHNTRVLIFPNPVKNNLNIKIENHLRDNALEIIDSRGRVIAHYPRIEEKLDIQHLNPGIYHIKSILFSYTIIKTP